MRRRHALELGNPFTGRSQRIAGATRSDRWWAGQRLRHRCSFDATAPAVDALRQQPELRRSERADRNSIDGVVVVDEAFAVEGQHNWIAFELDVSPGDHILTATSNTGAQLTVEFTTKAGQPRWTVVDYWWYPEDGPRKFTFDIHDEPIAFA